MAGANAAQIAAGMEAEVTVVDRNVDRLREIDRVWHGRIQTVMSSALAVERLVLDADLVVGAVLVPGAKAPHLVTAETVSAMQPGSVLVDISIDQGGCFETSHVTTHSDPTFVVDGVVHYCVGNMPGAVPRTSTYALTNVTLPYVVAIADQGLDEAVRRPGARPRGERHRRRDHERRGGGGPRARCRAARATHRRRGRLGDRATGRGWP